MEIVGRTIGRYQIVELIGEGGMAHVYRAYDPDINRSVALKVLRAEHCSNEEHTQRFLKEGKAAGALAHPSIVTIYDVGRLDEAPYIMMELLEGNTLGDLMREGSAMSALQTLDIGIEIAGALDYAHSKGVVHRDLKPDNIMINIEEATAKIADFGIARVEKASDRENTQIGMMLGTPRYMSPEQASGTSIDGRSDLFTLGVILYEMMTGHKAFDAESMPTLIMQIVQKDPIPIRQINSDAPIGLQKIIAKLLQKKPDKRFQNGRELLTALKRERKALTEDAEERRGYLPLQFKWTAIMGSIVALAMVVSSVLVFRAQSHALTQQAIDSGISLARFTAVQAAMPVLGEDWITLDSFVKDAAQRQSFRYLVVSDHKGIVRSATDDTLVGNPWNIASDMASIVYSQSDVTVTRLEVTAGEVFNFQLPVLFGDTVVGEVNLALDTAHLESALSTTRRMMLILGLAMVLSVSVVIYIFNKLIAKNLLLTTQALQLFSTGNRETRISKRRSDEFGDLFTAYNEMADELEQLVESGVDNSPDHNDSRKKIHSPLDVSGITQSMVEDQTIVRPPDYDG